jgi:2-polyprenyl-3-methyl-5-hydroxy-6-metoxy-1,4-benzoquinol methylase
MNNTLTTRQFWIDYWESKTDLAYEVTKNYPFIDILSELVLKNNSKSLLEIGGFPGYFSVWSKSKMGIQSTLFDYVIVQKIINDLEEKNGLQKNSIEIIEGDLFKYNSQIKYDLVVSNGLIEHFSNTKNILEKHKLFLNHNGSLLVTLPNFKGLNGWFQKRFDPQNYEKHNINCMNLNLLKNICSELGFKNINVRYSGRFMLWLENELEKPLMVRVLKKIVWLPLKLIFKILPIETKYFSPYIVITAKNP